MENDLELEGLLFEDEENKNILTDQDTSDVDKTITERWSCWVNIINRNFPQKKSILFFYSLNISFYNLIIINVLKFNLFVTPF